MAMSRFVVTLGLCVSASAIKLFEPGDFNPEDVWVGSACEKVLRTEIDCDKYIFEFTVPEFRGQSSKDLEMADTICSNRCSDSLRNWYPKLVKECAEEDFMSDTYPTNYWLYIGNSMSSGWNQTCAKDPKTGRYCGEIINEFSKVEDDEEMPLEELCHPCYVKMINMRSTSFAWPSLEDPGGKWWPKQLELVKEKCSGTESKKDASYLDEKESAEEETTSVTPHKTASADGSGVGPMPTASTSSTEAAVSESAAQGATLERLWQASMFAVAVQEFVSLWTTVVKETVSVKLEKIAKRMDDFRQAERSLEMHSRISKLQESLSATSQENDQIQKQYQRDVKRLRRNIKDLEQELRESKGGNNITEQKSLAMKFDVEHVFRPKIIHLEQKLKESQDRNNISEGRLSAMRTKLEKLQAQTMSDWLARNRLEIESKSLKVELINAQKKLDEDTSINEKNRDFDNQIKNLERKIKQYTVMLEDTAKKARANEDKVVTERAAKESMEKRYKAQLTERDGEISRLKHHREELEETVSGLQASIDACWWHRFQAWKERFRKRNKSGSWISIADGTNEDIGLKTYA
ncbi:hypothetical protein AU210_015000 [Fusarium oxysporum f. sp. radicis-cucumerinum]|uniref:Uncharacterized protein n=1 Tax=Fusarium oxysporum f. sp. radicis-cucumerinum TaxID=327505 RepID=A0A2H3FZZ2_FUSOX|nr:hypothetical protein AU210_015000 [Fusarium oxysporum f. sp. radicis-cucumerinum]